MLAEFKKRLLRYKPNSLARLIENSGFFDRHYYLACNPDVAAAGQDPLLHFILHGASEGRSPSPNFDLLTYLGDNPAALSSGLNPVADWLTFGLSGTRKPPTIVSTSAQNNVPYLSPKEHGKLKELAVKLGLFNEAYYLAAYPDVGVIQGDPFRHYMLTGHKENRNPSSEFDTHFYETQYSELLTKRGHGRALIHYLREGLHTGLRPRPEDSITLSAEDKTPLPRLRAAVHIHLFYVEMAELFAGLLEKISFEFDLFISVCGEANVVFVTRVFERIIPYCHRVVRAVPNRGRDLAPFFLAFPEIWNSYDAVLHLHSKKSPHTDFGASWSDWCLRSLISKREIVLAALDQFEKKHDLAVLFPDNHHRIKEFAGWNANHIRINALLARFRIQLDHPPLHAHFAAGSMGWYRTAVFKSFAEEIRLNDFENEEGQVEGTFAHVIERTLPLYAKAREFRVSTFYLSLPPALPVIETIHAPASVNESVGDRWMRDTPSIARWQPKALSPYVKLYNPKALEISWIIPDFTPGAGGHMTIFRMVQLLEAFGHHQTVWIQNPRNYPNPTAALAAIRTHYRQVGEKVGVRFLPDDVRQLSGDAVIATDCWTAFPTANATNFKERFYFIQDHEPSFHPMGENYLIAESTYRMGFAALCAGEWLLEKARSYGMWARKWELASDPEFYFPGNSRLKHNAEAPHRIAFYGRSYTPRRAVNLGLAAFEELSRRRGDFEVLMFGQAPENCTYKFPYCEMGNLSPEGLGQLYRSCDIGVSFSTTNYSLVPLEMMACGLPVIEIDSESTRIAFPGDAVSLAAPNPLSVADAIERLLDCDSIREVQIAKASKFVRSLDWMHSAKALEASIHERLLETGSRPIDPDILARPQYLRPKKISVVIPTYNGGAVFHCVLDRIIKQSVDFEFDVLVMDSSSDDGTAEYVKNIGGKVRLETISKEQFQHGRTRNLAISATDGELVALLTQDALPADDKWLANLAGGFDYGPRVAGVIGRHRAYPDHNPLLARDLERMFARFADLGPVFSIERGLPNFLPRGCLEWRMIMHFFSDNNSAMRRSVWQELPYPEVDWGEDQIWAWNMLKLGFSKVYIDSATVLHSHEFLPAKQLSVAIEEGKLFREHFGYTLHPDRFDEAAFKAFEQHERSNATKYGLAQSAVDTYVSMMKITIEGRTLGSRSVSAN